MVESSAMDGSVWASGSPYMRLVVFFSGQSFIVVLPSDSSVRQLKEEITRVHGGLSNPHITEHVSKVCTKEGHLLFDEYSVSILLPDMATVYAFSQEEDKSCVQSTTNNVPNTRQLPLTTRGGMSTEHTPTTSQVYNYRVHSNTAQQSPANSVNVTSDALQMPFTPPDLPFPVHPSLTIERLNSPHEDVSRTARSQSPLPSNKSPGHWPTSTPVYDSGIVNGSKVTDYSSIHEVSSNLSSTSKNKPIILEPKVKPGFSSDYSSPTPQQLPQQKSKISSKRKLSSNKKPRRGRTARFNVSIPLSSLRKSCDTQVISNQSNCPVQHSDILAVDSLSWDQVVRDFPMHQGNSPQQDITSIEETQDTLTNTSQVPGDSPQKDSTEVQQVFDGLGELPSNDHTQLADDTSPSPVVPIQTNQSENTGFQSSEVESMFSQPQDTPPSLRKISARRKRILSQLRSDKRSRLSPRMPRPRPLVARRRKCGDTASDSQSPEVAATKEGTPIRGIPPPLATHTTVNSPIYSDNLTNTTSLLNKEKSTDCSSTEDDLPPKKKPRTTDSLVKEDTPTKRKSSSSSTSSTEDCLSASVKCSKSVEATPKRKSATNESSIKNPTLSKNNIYSSYNSSDSDSSPAPPISRSHAPKPIIPASKYLFTAQPSLPVEPISCRPRAPPTSSSDDDSTSYSSESEEEGKVPTTSLNDQPQSSQGKAPVVKKGVFASLNPQGSINQSNYSPSASQSSSRRVSVQSKAVEEPLSQKEIEVARLGPKAINSLFANEALWN